MQNYEYIAIPAPRRGTSAKGVKGVPGKFANAVTGVMNEMAVEGWEYLRSDTLPCEERQGLTGKTVKYHAMLVFRRRIEVDDTHLALPPPDAVPGGDDVDDDTPPEDMLDELVEEHAQDADAPDDDERKEPPIKADP